MAKWYEGIADIPLIGSLTGAAGARERDERRASEGRIRQEVAGLAEYGEGVDEELYGEEMLEGDPRLGDVRPDKNAAAAQLEALQALQEVVGGKGLTAIDRARIARNQAQERAVERGQREAIMQQMQARGMGGSGSELAQRLMAQQSGADRLNMANLDVERMAQERALQAMQALGSQAGSMRGQSFGEAATRASAIDEANRRNTEWRRRRAQDRYGRAENRTALATQQYAGQAQRSREATRDEDEQRSGLAGAIISALA